MKEHWKIEIIKHLLKKVDEESTITRNQKRDMERTIYYYNLGREFERRKEE